MFSNVITTDYADTQKLGEQFAATLQTGDVVALHGDLGSGKTTFTQGLAKGLGITSRILSPTFLIMRTYQLPADPGNFIHADLYRTNGELDVKGIGLDALILSGEHIVIVEWPEKITSLLPTQTKHVTFEYLEDDKRSINFA